MKFKSSKMAACQSCDLKNTRTQVVLPIIHDKPLVFFLGEAPGKNEDLTGIPFVGTAGKWHQAITSFIGVTSFIVANTVGCRPTKLSHKGNVINGKPTEEQIKICSKWLNTLLLSYDYKLLVLYGGYAINRILARASSVSSMVGKFREVTIKNRVITTYSCYHPATLVYDKQYYRPLWKEHLTDIKNYLGDFV